MKPSFPAALRLLPIPLLVLAAALLSLDSRGPFWLGTNSDPSYAYALNSLRLLEGEAPTHLDHPGLTVHLFGAAVFWTSHRLAHRDQPLADDVLAHPEWYLGTAVRTLAMLFAASLFLLGFAAFQLTQRWGLAWIAQLGPLLSPSVFFELTDFKPEPVLYLITTLLAAAVGIALTRGEPERSAFAITLGILVGLAVATKLTALSLLVAPLVLHRTRRARLAFCLSAAVAFLLCALPALPNWRLAVAFVWRVSSGSGLYGVGLLAGARPYLDQWKRIGIEEAPFFLVLLVAIAAALRARERPPEVPLVVRAIVALVLTSLCQLAIAAKHPYQPRYLVPALALSGFLLVLSLQSLRSPGIGVPDPGPALAIVLVLGLAAHQAPRFLRRDAQLRAAARCQIEARARAVASGCRIVSYYRGSSPSFALFHADVSAHGLFRDRLGRLFPDEAFLSPEGALGSFGGSVHLAELGDTCVVLQGSPGGPRHPLAATSDRPFDGIAGLSAVRPVFACGWEEVFEREAPARRGPTVD